MHARIYAASSAAYMLYLSFWRSSCNYQSHKASMFLRVSIFTCSLAVVIGRCYCCRSSYSLEKTRLDQFLSNAIYRPAPFHSMSIHFSLVLQNQVQYQAGEFMQPFFSIALRIRQILFSQLVQRRAQSSINSIFFTNTLLPKPGGYSCLIPTHDDKHCRNTVCSVTALSNDIKLIIHIK